MAALAPAKDRIGKFGETLKTVVCLVLSVVVMGSVMRWMDGHNGGMDAGSATTLAQAAAQAYCLKAGSGDTCRPMLVDATPIALRDGLQSLRWKFSFNLLSQAGVSQRKLIIDIDKAGQVQYHRQG